jgi:hypothetical protein
LQYVPLKTKKSFIQGIRKFITILKQEKPDLVVSSIYKTDLISRVACFLTNTKIIGTFINDTYGHFSIQENKENKNYIGRYGFEINSIEAVDNIKKSLYKIENVDKPIKSFSSYKLPDLIDMCNKLAIEIKNKETGKNKSKNELYESIIQYF